MRQYSKFDSDIFNSIRELNERAIVLWELGELVDEREKGKYEIKIYALHDFFVEVWVNTKRAEVEKVFALEDDKDWDGFLESIKLAEIFS